MKFSSYLRKIYENKNSNITRQEDFITELFNSAGATFNYEESYPKKIFNGSKPLSEDVRNTVPDVYNDDGVIYFFSECINQRRLEDLLETFEIDADEKKKTSTY